MASPARPEAGHNRAATGPNAITLQSGREYQLRLAKADNRRATNQSLSSVRPTAVLFRVSHSPIGRQTRPLWCAPVSCEGQHDRLGPFRSENSWQWQEAANQRMPTGKAILASMETHSERLPSERKSLAVAREVSTLFTDSISASLTDSRVG
jgi:hypothetical protein